MKRQVKDERCYARSECQLFITGGCRHLGSKLDWFWQTGACSRGKSGVSRSSR